MSSRVVFGVLVALLAISAERASRITSVEGLAGGFYQSHNSRTFVLASGALIALLLVAGVFASGRARLAILAVPASAAAGVLAGTALLGGRLGDMVLAMLTLAACWFTGERVLSALRLQALAAVWPLAFVIGGGVLGTGVLLLGKAELLYWWSAGLLFCSLGVAGGWRLSSKAWGHRHAISAELTRSPLETGAASVLLVVFTWIAVYTAAPEVTYDPLYAKAWLPQHWASINAVDAMVEHPVMGNAGFAQLLATPGHLFGAHAVGRYLQLAAWVVLATTLWWFGRRHGAAGALAAVSAVVVPASIWQATNANDDLILALAAVGLALAVLIGRPGIHQERPWAFAIGLAAGACVLFKLHLGPLAAALAGGWALSGGRHDAPRRLAWIVAGGVLMVAPTLAVRWIEYGNPVFPNYNNIFRSPYFPPINDTLNLPYWQDPSLREAVLAPWYAIWRPDLMNEVAPPGMFGALIPAILLVIAFGWRRWGGRRTTIVPWLAIVAAVGVWWISQRYLRYLLPAGFVAVLAVVMAASPQVLSRRAATMAAVVSGATAVAALAIFVPISYMIPDRKPPLAAAFGRWDEADYLRRTFVERDTVVAFDRIAPKGAMAVGSAYQRAWLTGNRDLTPAWELLRVLSIDGPLPARGPALLKRLEDAGVGWAITGPNDPVTQGLLTAGAEPAFGSNGWAMFRFTAKPAAGLDTSCDRRFSARRGTCWLGATLDANPGMRWVEDFDGVTRSTAACPGTILEVTARTSADGAPSTVSVNSPSSDPKAGATAMTIPPGSTSKAYLTIPNGATEATITAVAGERGTLAAVSTRVFGRCTASGANR